MPGRRLSEEAQPLKAISIDELEEQAEEIDYLTPRELAKLLGLFPQQVYRYIRKGIFEAERCKCGRVVICVSRARETLALRDKSMGYYIRPSDDPKIAVEDVE